MFTKEHGKAVLSQLKSYLRLRRLLSFFERWMSGNPLIIRTFSSFMVQVVLLPSLHGISSALTWSMAVWSSSWSECPCTRAAGSLKILVRLQRGLKCRQAVAAMGNSTGWCWKQEMYIAFCRKLQRVWSICIRMILSMGISRFVIEFQWKFLLILVIRLPIFLSMIITDVLYQTLVKAKWNRKFTGLRVFQELVSHVSEYTSPLSLYPFFFLVGGTLRWKAPELLEGSSTLTQATDVYAFAILCIEVLAMGQVPWCLDDDESVRHFVLSKVLLS